MDQFDHVVSGSDVYMFGENRSSNTAPESRVEGLWSVPGQDS